MKTPITSSALLVAAILSGVSAQTVLLDTFNADLGGTNPNSDVNLDTVTRQSGGSTTTAYSANGNTGSFLNVPGGGPFSGQTVLLLRTSSTGGSSASNSGVTTDTNFASSLTGQIYKIEFTGAIEQAGSPSTDNWGSFFLTDSSTAVAPNAGGTDYGILYRERDTNNLTLWDDAAGTTSTVANGGTSPFNAGTLFTIGITVNEITGTVDTVINAGTVGEIALPTGSVDFENSTDRYFGFRANQGGATGLVDFRFDDFSVSIVPEPSSFALLSGALALGWIMVRRRK